MKRLLLLLPILLMACGSVKIHENVDEEHAKDAMQVMDRISYYVDKEISIEDVDEKDHLLFERYTNKYIEKTDVIPVNLEGVDKSINIMATAALVRYAKGATLESDKEDIKESYDYMIQFIKEGKSASDEPRYRKLEYED